MVFHGHYGHWTLWTAHGMQEGQRRLWHPSFLMLVLQQRCRWDVQCLLQGRSALLQGRSALLRGRSALLQGRSALLQGNPALLQGSLSSLQGNFWLLQRNIFLLQMAGSLLLASGYVQRSFWRLFAFLRSKPPLAEIWIAHNVAQTC